MRDNWQWQTDLKPTECQQNQMLALLAVSWRQSVEFSLKKRHSEKKQLKNE